MPINPAIAMGVRGIELADPLAQYGRVAAIQQAQQQNALAQLQMRQAEREQEATNALNAAYREAYNPQTGDVDLNKLRSSLATGGYGAKLPDLEKKFGELKTQRLTQQKTEGEIAGQALTRTKTEGDILDAALKRSRGFLENLDPSAPGAAEAYLAWHEANHRDPIIGPALAARGITAEQSRGRIAQMLNTPGGLARLINESKLGTEEFMKANKPQTQVIDQYGQKVLLERPGLGGEWKPAGVYADVPLPAGVEAQKARLARAGAAQTKVVLPEQEKAFESELGKGQAKALLESRTGAEDARSIIDTVNQGRDILKSGMITGAGADFLVSLNQGLKTVGIDLGYADAAANSQAFMANMGQNVGKLIKQFGAGTGLSDADRKYAEQIAGGKINLDSKALTKILDINERAARNVIKAHNKKAEGVKTNVPLKVEEPTTARQLSPMDQQALDWANANPKDPRAAQIKQRLGM